MQHDELRGGLARGIQQELDREIGELERHLKFWRDQGAALDRPKLLRAAANLVQWIEREIETRRNAKSTFDQ
jgi:hypothetical protein